MQVPFGAIEINVEQAGAGEPVVMIHSSGMSSRQWRGLAKALASTHRAVMPDLLGYGGTRGWIAGDAFAIDEDTQLVLAVIRALDQPVHLVGHSYGGMLALQVARAIGDRVNSIAIYEPVAWGVAAGESDGPVQRELARFGESFFAPGQGASADWHRRFVDFWNGEGTWDAMPEEQRAAFLAVGDKVTREVRALCFDPTPASAYAGLTAPTLILGGETTPAAERRVCEVLAATIPNAIYERFPGIGHMGILVKPAEVNARIAAHVREVR
jgi:pimeloyl-ACP methyl ester carboxylesterase